MNNLISFTPDRNNYIGVVLDHIRSDILPDIDYYIAGGSALKYYLRGDLGNSDIDLFFKCKEDLDAAVRHIEGKAVRLARSENCLFFVGTIPAPNNEGPYREITIQLIVHGLYPTISDLLNSFDFTITQFCYHGGKLWCTEQALSDCHSKIIRVNPLKKENNRLKFTRILKYMEYGFEPDSELFEKVLIDGRTSFDGSSITESLTEAIYDFT